MKLRHSLLPALLLLCTSCIDNTIEFRVCGDVTVPDQIDALRFLVLDEQLNEIHAGVRELDGPLPVSSSLPNSSGNGWTKVQGLLGSVEVIAFARRVGQLDDVSTVDILLDQQCLGLDCPLGQTCVTGICILAPVGSEAPNCP